MNSIEISLEEAFNGDDLARKKLFHFAAQNTADDIENELLRKLFLKEYKNQRYNFAHFYAYCLMCRGSYLEMEKNSQNYIPSKYNLFRYSYLNGEHQKYKYSLFSAAESDHVWSRINVLELDLRERNLNIIIYYLKKSIVTMKFAYLYLKNPNDQRVIRFIFDIFN